MRSWISERLRGTRGFLIVGGIPLAAVVALFTWGIARGADQHQDAGADVAPPVVQLIRNPQEFLGQEVRVTAAVGELIGDRAYTIVPRKTPQSDLPPILVIQDEPFPSIDALRADLQPGSVVDVTGRFQRYVEGKFEEQLDDEQLDEQLLQRFGERPAILAWSTVVVPTADERVRPQRIEGQAVSIAEIAGAPERYTGRYVRIQGDVTRVLGPRLFVVDDRILVADPVPGTAQGTFVVVEGYVRTLPPAELSDETGIDFDQDTMQRLQGLPSMPAIVAYQLRTPRAEAEAGGEGQTRTLPDQALPFAPEPERGSGG